MSRPDHARNTFLLPDQPFTGELVGVPRVYRHAKCGGETEMPERVIRNYLAQPFLFQHETEVWCAGCGKHVSIRSVQWTETGQQVAVYIGELQDRSSRPGGVNYRPADPLGILALLVLIAAPILGGLYAFGLGAAVGGAIGVLVMGSWWVYRRLHPLVPARPSDTPAEEAGGSALPAEDDPGRSSGGHGYRGGRVYVHTSCGGLTRISGGDFAHLCDPCWPCNGTYCCQCAGFAQLKDVRWQDTGETVARYRTRLWAQTPLLLKVWHYGVGFLIGGALGAGMGLLVGFLAQAPQHRANLFTLGGGLAGAIAFYFLGRVLLHRALGFDYRQVR